MSMDAGRIKERMDVMDNDGHKVGTVDKIDGEFMKLTKDGSPDGEHHWLPVSVVQRVDQHVHLSLGHDEAQKQWLHKDPHQH